jgi:hypothetical protein
MVARAGGVASEGLIAVSASSGGSTGRVADGTLVGVCVGNGVGVEGAVTVMVGSSVGDTVDVGLGVLVGVGVFVPVDVGEDWGVEVAVTVTAGGVSGSSGGVVSTVTIGVVVPKPVRVTLAWETVVRPEASRS